MSGVRSFNLRPQTWVQTEGDGWSNSDDYALGVWDANGNRVPPGTPIPPGEYVSVGGPAPGRPPAASPSIPAQTAAANNTATLSTATANNAQAAAATKNADTNAQIAANTNTRNAQLHDEFLANLGLTKQQIDNQYAKDVADLGLQKATLLLTSRTAAASVASQQANFLLSQNQFNAQQRQEMGRQTLDALKMLADRNGPQDWTRWDYMSAGENAPNPTSSKTYSPLEMIQGQYQESNIAAPAGLDLSGIDFSGGGMPAASTASAPAMTPTTAAVATTNPSPNGIKPTETYNPVASGPVPYQQNTSAPTATTTAPATTSYGPGGNILGKTVQHYAEGGATSNAAITGDLPGQSNAEIKNDPHTELVYSAKNPQTGVVETHVIPHAQLAQMMDKEMGRAGGMVMGMHKVPKEMAAILPRMATGGVVAPVPPVMGGEFDPNYPLDTSQIDDQRFRKPTLLDLLLGLPPTSHTSSGGGMQSGGPLWPAPDLPPPDPGYAGGDPTGIGLPDARGSYGGGFIGDMVRAAIHSLPRMATGGTLYSSNGVQPLTNPSTATAPQSAPGQMAYGTTSSGSTAAITPGPQAVTTGAPTAVGGQVANLGGAVPDAVSNGPGQYDPYRITKNTYDANTMNNSPVLQMIRGQRPVYGYGGHGSFAPSVPSQGITDLPTNLNYGDLLRMDPNRVKMLQGLYSNPESGWSWDTVLNDAKNAAPKTANFGVTRAR